MRCPNCGEEMAEGALYCEHCGEDIHIVPDFEPELEENIQQSISSMLEEMGDGKKEASEESSKADEMAEPPKKKRRLWQLAIPLAVLVVAASVAMGIWVYHYNSEEYQVQRAVQCVARERYDEAVSHYNRALELDPDNIELRFSLAEVYFLKNNKVEYEYLLREIAKDENATSEQLDRAYGRLIAIYRARGDYETINTLLLNSGNEQLITTYQSYIANPPDFSIMEGDYTGVQALMLMSGSSGSIYYTLDGSDPDENSDRYSMPILLENGDYVVKAVFINNNGVVSEIAEKRYHIENDVISAPEVSLDSGTYTSPVSIQVFSETDDVYYTTDGSAPSILSNIYTEPIPLPLGHSHFEFARIVDGVVGEVTERNYNFNFEAEYTQEQAEALMKEYALSVGKIIDEAGHIDTEGAMYVYEFLYVGNIGGVNDLYVIAEVLREADGLTQNRTGSFFAVDAHTGIRYRLQQSESGSFYGLTAIDEINE